MIFRKIKFKDFVTEIQEPRDDRVLYLQQQNNSFNTEFSKLMSDVDSAPKWSSDVFGQSIFILKSGNIILILV